jgi:hypothetical protein
MALAGYERRWRAYIPIRHLTRPRRHDWRPRILYFIPLINIAAVISTSAGLAKLTGHAPILGGAVGLPLIWVIGLPIHALIAKEWHPDFAPARV